MWGVGGRHWGYARERGCGIGLFPVATRDGAVGLEGVGFLQGADVSAMLKRGAVVLGFLLERRTEQCVGSLIGGGRVRCALDKGLDWLW